VSSAVGESSAVRPAHVGQAPKGGPAPADTSDQTSPFAALLDAADANAPLPPVQPPLPTASPKPSTPTQESAPQGQFDNASAAQKAAPADNTIASSTPSTPQVGDQSVPTPLATEPKKDAKTPDSNTNAQPDPTLAALALAASSTASANTATVPPTDGEAGKPKADPKGDSATPADASAGQAASPAPQLPALPLSAPVAPSAPAPASNGSDATGAGSAGVEALTTLQSGALRGNTVGQTSGKTPSTSAVGSAAPSSNIQPPQDSAAAADASQVQSATDAAAVAAQASAAQASAANTAAETAGARLRAAAAQSNEGASAQDATQSASNADGSPDTDLAAGTPSSDPGSTISDSTATGKRDTAAPATGSTDAVQTALDAALKASPFGAAGSAHTGNPDATQSTLSGASLATPAILTTAFAPAAAPISNPTPPAVPISGLAVEIAASAQAGNNRFEIRLDPPELGRIEVQLNVDHDGKVTSKLVVDRPETLALLQRDAPDLQRSLEQAGLQTSDNGLQFSLRDQGGFAGQNPYSNNGSPARIVIPDSQAPAIDTAAATYGRALSPSGGIDIRV
jgi:flagellar hook-length control protein FliK